MLQYESTIKRAQEGEQLHAADQLHIMRVALLSLVMGVPQRPAGMKLDQFPAKSRAIVIII